MRPPTRCRGGRTGSVVFRNADGAARMLALTYGGMALDMRVPTGKGRRLVRLPRPASPPRS